MHRDHPQRRNAGAAPTDFGQGFTLIEVLMAVMLLAIVLPAITAATGNAVTVKSELAEDEVSAAILAREIHEMARGLARQPSGSTGARTGQGVLALDSLVGARFSPPLRSDRTAESTRSEWTQQVDIVVYALDDLQVPTGESATQAFSRHADRLLRLNVTMLRNGEAAGEFGWWITP